MRLLRDSLTFGAVFGAPVTAFFKEVVLPFTGALCAVCLLAGWCRGRLKR